MVDQWGNQITGMRQGKLLYEVTNNGQISRCFNMQSFYEYDLVTDSGKYTGFKITLDPTQAIKFCELNNLIYVR